MKKLNLILNMLSYNKRGFVREGYYADFALLDLEQEWIVEKKNIQYHCGWSPLESHSFKGLVTHTFINGHLANDNGKFDDSKKGMRLEFRR